MTPTLPVLHLLGEPSAVGHERRGEALDARRRGRGSLFGGGLGGGGGAGKSSGGERGAFFCGIDFSSSAAAAGAATTTVVTTTTTTTTAATTTDPTAAARAFAGTVDWTADTSSRKALQPRVLHHSQQHRGTRLLRLTDINKTG